MGEIKFLKKPIKIGDSFGIIIPSAYIKNKVIDINKVYECSMKEEEGNNAN